ncbi:MAG: hypothetical protein L0Z71_15735 [Anaerolineae bacterium]|nr:hypothetical protein [Anaerolineae bacterium]
MKRFEKIPAELKKRRTKIVRDVTLDDLLSSTIATDSEYGTNIVARFIDLILDEYIFLREIEIFRDVMNYNLEFPSRLGGVEFSREYYAATDKLEKEFRERFYSDTPPAKIEWKKLADFLDKTMETT